MKTREHLGLQVMPAMVKATVEVYSAREPALCFCLLPAGASGTQTQPKDIPAQVRDPGLLWASGQGPWFPPAFWQMPVLSGACRIWCLHCTPSCLPTPLPHSVLVRAKTETGQTCKIQELQSPFWHFFKEFLHLPARP